MRRAGEDPPAETSQACTAIAPNTPDPGDAHADAITAKGRVRCRRGERVTWLSYTHLS